MAKQSSISSTTTIVGRISGTGDLEVAGHVNGNVLLEGALALTADGTIKGDVRANEVLVAGGAVAGSLSADQSLMLASGARVVGDLVAPTIAVHAGALLRGHIETGASPGAVPGRGTSVTKAAPTTKRVSAKSPRRSVAKVAVGTKSAGKTRAAKPTVEKKRARKGAPEPTLPKAAGRGRKAGAKRRRRAPAPVVPALKKRTKKASKRRGG